MRRTIIIRIIHTRPQTKRSKSKLSFRRESKFIAQPHKQENLNMKNIKSEH